MPDIHFLCHACTSPLAISSEGCGKEIPCPHCNEAIVIPLACFKGNCPACAAEFMLAENAVGVSVNCTECHHEILKNKGDPGFIVRFKLPAGHKAGDPIDQHEEEPPKTDESDDATCPTCQTPKIPEAVFCLKCGLNFKTGKPGNVAPPPTPQKVDEEQKPHPRTQRWKYEILTPFIHRLEDYKQPAVIAAKALLVLLVVGVVLSKFYKDDKKALGVDLKKPTEITNQDQTNPTGPTETNVPFKVEPLEPEPIPEPVVAKKAPASWRLNKYSVLDYLATLFIERDQELSIDPAAMNLLLKKTVRIDTIEKTTLDEQIKNATRKYKLNLKTIPVAGDKKIQYLVEPGVQSYCLAIARLMDNQPEAALKNLDYAIRLGEPEFKAYSQSLIQTIKSIQSTRIIMAQFWAQIGTKLDRITQLAAQQKTKKRFAQPVKDDPNAARELKTLKDECCGLLDKIFVQLQSNNQQIIQQLVLTEMENHASEAGYLLGQMIKNLNIAESYRKKLETTGNIRCAGHAGHVDMTEVAGMQKSLEAAYRQGKAWADKGMKHLGTDNDQAYKSFMNALEFDPSIIQSRFGMGYFILENIVASYRLLGPEGEAKRTDLLKRCKSEFFDGQKNGHLRALSKIEDTSEDGLVPIRDRTGMVKGLVVTGDKGNLYSGMTMNYIVRLQPVKSNALKKQEIVKALYGGYRSGTTEKQAYPILFGDYGMKDVYTKLSAIEAFKWLKSIDPSGKIDQGMIIDLEELTIAKGGDSAGATIATAGFSRLWNWPIKQDVAMTGAIRASGQIKKVGGIPLKIVGAWKREGVEIVIVPRDNRAELMTLDPELLYQVVLIISDDVQTHLKYALSPDYSIVENGSPELGALLKSVKAGRESIQNLQQAQMLILSGDIPKAQTLLTEIHRLHPEIWTAKRLLEIIHLNEMMAK